MKININVKLYKMRDRYTISNMSSYETVIDGYEITNGPVDYKVEHKIYYEPLDDRQMYHSIECEDSEYAKHFAISWLNELRHDISPCPGYYYLSDCIRNLWYAAFRAINNGEFIELMNENAGLGIRVIIED